MLSAFRQVRMSAGTARMPVLAALPTAGFVTDGAASEETGVKPTSKVSWTNKELIAEEIAADQPEPAGKPGREGLDALVAGRGLDIVTFRDWQKIDRAEIDRARDGSPREKFVRVADMVAASRG